MYAVDPLVSPAEQNERQRMQGSCFPMPTPSQPLIGLYTFNFPQDLFIHNPSITPSSSKQGDFPSRPPEPFTLS
ncbi:hypothetical protein LY78DRAFT_660292, partial [Colletotrichum sublineola]